MNGADIFHQQRRLWVRLYQKAASSKFDEMLCHALERYLAEH
jgi:hypothetical protein